MPVLPSLVTVDELATTLGRTFTTAEADQAQALLDQASSVVRGYLRQDVTRATTTDTFRVSRADNSRYGCGGLVVLPQRPVDDVTEVEINGTAVENWWLEGSTLLLPTAHWSPRWTSGAHGPPRATVTYTHGWDPVPGDITAIVMQAANRALVNPSQIRSETVGSESTTYLIPTTGEALGVLLSKTEQRVLDRYRRTSGTVRVRPA